MLGGGHFTALRLCHSEFRTRTPRQLTAGADRATHGFGNRIERDAEHVVQHERDPFARTEPLQDFHQRRAHLVVESDPIGRVQASRFRDLGVESAIGGTAQPLVAHSRRAHLIEAEPARDDGEPAADVVDIVGSDSRKPQKCLLRNIFGVTDISEDLISEIDQIRAVPAPGVGDLVGWRLGLVHEYIDDLVPEKVTCYRL